LDDDANEARAFEYLHNVIEALLRVERRHAGPMGIGLRAQDLALAVKEAETVLKDAHGLF
jgi:hypothetical protein